jgi:hypothetical protein
MPTEQGRQWPGHLIVEPEMKRAHLAKLKRLQTNDEGRKALLKSYVDDWLDCAGLQLRLADDISGFQIAPNAVGVFSTLAFDLAYVVSTGGGKRVVLCAVCGLEIEIPNASPKRSYRCKKHRQMAQPEYTKK